MSEFDEFFDDDSATKSKTESPGEVRTKQQEAFLDVIDEFMDSLLAVNPKFVLTSRMLEDGDDIDGVIEFLSNASKLFRVLEDWTKGAKAALAKIAEGKTLTRRVRGNARRAKLTFRHPGFDSSQLFEAWNSYPQFRDECLKIERIKVLKLEFDKMRNESGPSDWEQFRNMVAAAEKEEMPLPSVSVEETDS